jgi:ethanolamine utilization protein EutA
LPECLRSVGLDVGTTTTQLVLSELQIQNAASAFSVPQMQIADRKILYRSPVYFTPLLGENRVDGAAIRKIVDAEYAKAGIRKEDLDTGAVIITGETSRKENARAVLENLSEFAGDFVVATAGPHLESVLAAKGAGAVKFSEETGKTVLHMDIGGGTSNLALIEAGKITATGCMNVGGRLLKLDKDGKITYISPVLNGIGEFVLGQQLSRQQVENLAQKLVQALEMAAGLRPATDLLQKLWTEEAGNAHIAHSEKDLVLSFSGGVADCIENRQDWLNFGDIGPCLGQAIRESLLCSGEFRLGEQTIRATVIGAGCHSAQLSGSTVFHRNIRFPLKNLAVVRISEQEQTLPNLASIIQNRLQTQEQTAVLALPGFCAPDYAAVVRLAKALAAGFAEKPVYIALEQDMAKALGQALALQLPPDAPCLCIDSVSLEEGSFLNVAAPVGPALPVVIKTLILGG